VRLRDLGITIGSLASGRHNTIVDVPDIRVGHAQVEGDGPCTGITVVIPYPGRSRPVFIGRYGLDGGDGMTGLGITEDFGVISTPLVLAPAAAIGAVYDALISYGLAQDPGLSETKGWPPVVVSVDDTGANPPTLVHQAVREEHLHGALATAGRGPVAEGAVGIGRGLVAFGARGGVGTASRRLPGSADAPLTVGVLVAANGGEPERLSVDGFPVGSSIGLPRMGAEVPRTFAAVVATDAPLIPRQLDRLAGRTSLGLARAGLLDSHTREGMILCISTQSSSTQDPAAGDTETAGTADATMVGEDALPTLFAAASEAGEEAVLNALLATAPDSPPLRLRDGSSVRGLPRDVWVEEVKQYQRRARSRTRSHE